MALPTLDSVFASASDLPRRQMLAKWLVNLQYSGSIEDYWTLPEKYIYAKIAVASGATRSEADYIHLPDRYIWSDIYNAVSGSSGSTIDRGEKEALGWIAAAVRGDAGDPAKVATYINWPWRYQVASIITALAVDSNAQSFITTSGATDVEAIDQFVKGVKNLGLWDSMIAWPLRSTQNAGTGTTAYSLGGLGTYNGTLVNGPTWGTDGITFDGSNDYIEMANPFRTTTLSSYSIFAIFDSDQSVDRTVLSSIGGAGTRGPSLNAGWSPFGGTLASALFFDSTSDGTNLIGVANSAGQRASNGNTGNWQMGFAGGSGSEIGLSFNNEARGTQSLSPSVTTWNDNATWRFGARQGGNFVFLGPISFGILANIYLSPTQTAALYTLYKTTLGLNLGLP